MSAYHRKVAHFLQPPPWKKACETTLSLNFILSETHQSQEFTIT